MCYLHEKEEEGKGGEKGMMMLLLRFWQTTSHDECLGYSHMHLVQML